MGNQVVPVAHAVALHLHCGPEVRAVASLTASKGLYHRLLPTSLALGILAASGHLQHGAQLLHLCSVTVDEAVAAHGILRL
ncbi:hypothetical protein [Hymenobacter cellulosilyticus]|uniref:Uncharacterized protein n=1 Tax=Hymenobacter cellulosilyticus TaxID=2932248 RepID=A0A8T9QH70_9BACT|nr:hypothetical protein [Hymenobacter cellulosilyticus]UOQ75190.1 hypothetical protein MUN79_28795 [Hymenobacter cellulosilyticus]